MPMREQGINENIVMHTAAFWRDSDADGALTNEAALLMMMARSICPVCSLRER